MTHYICRTCGTQFAESDQPPAECPICQDERQYVGWEGQQRATLAELRQSAPGIDLAAKLAAALGTTLADLVPEGPAPDTDEVLRRQARDLFERVVTQTDRETLLLLNPLLNRLL